MCRVHFTDPETAPESLPANLDVIEKSPPPCATGKPLTGRWLFGTSCFCIKFRWIHRPEPVALLSVFYLTNSLVDTCERIFDFSLTY